MGVDRIWRVGERLVCCVKAILEHRSPNSSKCPVHAFMAKRAPSAKSLAGEKRTRYLSEFWGQAPPSTPSELEACAEASIEIDAGEEEDAPTTKVDPTFVAKVDSGAAVSALEEVTGVKLTEGNIAEFNATLKKGVPRVPERAGEHGPAGAREGPPLRTRGKGWL